MALTGTIEDNVYDDFKFIVDWSTVQNPARKTNTFTFKIYLDSSSAYSMSKIASTSGDSYINVSGVKIYFTTNSVSGTGKHLLATITTGAITTGNTKFSFYMRLYADYEFKVKKTITSSSTYLSAYFNTTYFTVDDFSAKSTMTVSGDRVLTLNNELVNTIDVTINDARYRHSIEYTCGKKTVSVCEKSSDSNITVNLPISLAYQNTSGMTVTVNFKITTLWTDDGVVGTQTVSIDYAIPDIEETKPSCTIKVTDGESVGDVRIFEKYGAYVQRKSRLNVVITPVLAYDSPIVTCSATVNNATYVDEYEFETGVLKYSGEQSITVTLTDKRGQTGEVVIPFNVLEYNKPSVSNVDIYRCDINGTADSSGGYLKVTFSAEVTPLNDMNSASYKMEYQTTSGLDQNEKVLTDYAGQYSVVNGTCIFAADNNSVYTVVITAIDDLDEGAKTSGRSLITILMNIMASGLGLAFGTTAGLENVFENAFKFFPSGGFMFPTLEAGSDIYGITTPNIYRIEEGQDIEHFPVDGSCTLIVLPGGGTNDLLYIVITGTPEILISRITDSSWSSWYRIGMTEV